MRSAHLFSRILLLALLLVGCTVPSPAPPPPATPEKPTPSAKPMPASADVYYRYGDEWRKLTPLMSHVPPGPAEIRLTFSKPVRQDEVERALGEAQPAPIRGLLEWADERTMYWRIAELPARIDFLLGGAHDRDGLALPGGLPSLRVGEQPALVQVDLAKSAEKPVANLPADIVSAALSADREYLNLTVWTPGSTRWDWLTADLSLKLNGLQFQSGWAAGLQPRLPAGLESWSLNPGRSLLAGLRLASQADAARRGERDLVLSDVLGGRQQVTPGFVARAGNAGNAGVVWSADGARVAALTDSAAGPGRSDLVAMDVAERKISTLVRDLPVAAGAARLAWSGDGRFLLAGPVLVDLQSGAQQRLPGDAATARGVWEPGKPRLLYSAKDWEVVLALDAVSGQSVPLGTGFLVDWAGAGQAYLIRWSAAGTRFVPPGQ